MSTIFKALTKLQVEAERSKMALRGELGIDAKRRELDHKWLGTVCVCLPETFEQVERIFSYCGSDRVKTLKYLTDRGCVFPQAVHDGALADHE